jgi:pimeloyl-ACP methyl ester carboxylesterase
MARMRANGIELEYEVMGEGEPLVLIMGIGSQLVMWPDDFCKGLVDLGFQVIRFDNRDVGLSSKITGGPRVNVPLVIAGALAGRPMEAAYTLVDMADDVAGLLDGLGIDQAHVVGCSLGGMIAQCFAIAHPNRLRSLTSIMSSAGGRRAMFSKPSAVLALLGRKAPRTAEENGENHLHFFRTAGSKGFPLDEADIRARARRSFERSNDRVGFLRQLAAMYATPARHGALRFVRVPSLVLHGSDDSLILPRSGLATARSIPGARYRLVEGMGHDLPRAAWPILWDEIAAVTRVGSARRRAA